MIFRYSIIKVILLEIKKEKRKDLVRMQRRNRWDNGRIGGKIILDNFGGLDGIESKLGV